MILKDLRDDPQGLELMWSLFQNSDLFLTLSSAVTTDTHPSRLIAQGEHGKRLEREFRGLDVAFGKAIENAVADRMLSGAWEGDLYRVKKPYRVYGDYYFIPSPNWPAGKLGLFQTRRALWYKATDNEAQRHVQQTVCYWSCRMLRDWALEHTGARIDMPCPEGHGLTFADTYNFMKMLPDNVFVWRIKNDGVII